jgi:hypothetical protein
MTGAGFAANGARSGDRPVGILNRVVTIGPPMTER